jgi:hypothetical protein
MPESKRADLRSKRTPTHSEDPIFRQARSQVEQIAQERFAPLVEKHGAIELPHKKDSWETHYYYQLAPDRAVDVWLDYREENVYTNLVKVSNGEPVEDSIRSLSKQQASVNLQYVLQKVLQIEDALMEEATQAAKRWAKAPRLTLGIATDLLTASAAMADRYFDVLVQQPEEVLFPMKWQPGQIQQTREVVSFTMPSEDMDQVREEIARLSSGASIAGWVEEAIREKLERSKQKP